MDIKPYEADMRHLLNTYVQADPAADMGNLNSLSLTELIVETGIHDAIARKLNEKGKLSRNAIAEGIINNVRKTIIRDQLTDPRFYAEMSKLLDDLIKQSRADAAAYESFLKRAEDLVKRMAKKDAIAGVPAALHGKPEAIVIYNNLPDIFAGGASVLREESPLEQEERAALALRIDQAMRESAPAVVVPLSPRPLLPLAHRPAPRSGPHGAPLRRTNTSANYRRAARENSKPEARNPKSTRMPDGPMRKTCRWAVVLVVFGLVLGIGFGFRVSDSGFGTLAGHSRLQARILAVSPP